MRNICTLIGGLLLASNLSAQTQIFGAAGNGDFEAGATGWTIVNGSQTNKWVVGSGATPGFGGSKAIYISRDGGTTHRYDTTSASISYFYRDIAIPAGTTNGWMLFDYISAGERTPWGMYNYLYPDALNIYVVSPSVAITAGNMVPGAYQIAGFTGQSSWFRKYAYPFINLSDYAGSTMRIVFQWQNDNVRGAQPPAALDNIEIYTSCQGGTSLSVSNVGPTTASIGWNTISGATAYQVRYRRHSEPETVATYATPVTFNGGSAYSGSLSGLVPGSEYIAEVRPVGLACTDYTRPASFVTPAIAVNDTCNGALAVAVTDTGSLTSTSFMGATPGTGLSSACTFGDKADVWYRFTAGNARQLIEAAGGSYGSSFGGTFQVYRGGCGTLQLVTTNCPSDARSLVNGDGYSSRLLLTSLVPGEAYLVRVLAGGYSSSATFRLSVLNEPSGTPVCTPAAYPASGAAVPAGSQTLRWNVDPNAFGYYYQVIPSSGWSVQGFTKDTFLVFDAATTGNYSWTVRPANRLDAGPASCTTNTFTAAVLTAVSTITIDDASVRFYPNPVQDKLHVTVAGGRRTRVMMLRLVDAGGRTVRTATLKTGTTVVPVTGLPAGVYHAVVGDGNSQRTVRLLKSH
ncbi:T9SS type A sorting domain-containing protein [Flaviaesturariibacter flavus]|uniref:T9SS type A sorting domain-containing protein n=1 Tax=Flaviaesturariibacter flavus TaxID=2502780 RepID=A0A4R1BMF1_9BACT|nr:T9SS type A sorting domain-containing protein [Flaviaesturariibacter flavus]TCJ18604.1 T9SS type A sorting domain-containing protein [Flaviaesturariibacter flavus]